MAETTTDRTKLLHRVRRVRGQLDAVERGLEQELSCVEILHTIAACRGAIDALMGAVIEGHIREHLVDPAAVPTSSQTRAAEELIDIVKSYLK